MKIDAQSKIAELERRIVALEEAAKERLGTSRERIVVERGGIFGEDWDKMWASFDRVMKRAFGR